MPDAMDHLAIRRYRKRAETCVAGFTFRTAEFHFDELVVLQGALSLGDDRGGDTGVADEKHGVQCVTQTSKVLALAF